jgi:hypothetical protein
MAKNLIPEIIQMLGVAIGEEFKIKDKHGEFVSDKTYKFSENALMYFHQEDDNIYRIVSRTTLCSLLNGNYGIVKLPWKPKKGEYYYTFELLGDKWVVHSSWWGGFPNEYAMLDKGWVYRTCEEAEAALPKVAEELGVEYEL